MRKILIINNSFIPVQIVLGNEKGVLFSIKENPPSKYPNNIIFIIQQFFNAFHMKPGEISEVAVAVGPGSFTGTRISVVEGKILAFALNIPLITINSLDIIGKEIKKGFAAIFAGRMEVFIAEFEDGKRKSKDRCVPLNEAIKIENLFFPSREEAEKSKIPNAKFVEISANTLLTIAYEKIEKGNFTKDPLSVNPVYLRSTDIIFRKRK